MSRFEQTITPAYFDAMYADSADPWRFASSPYEEAKYAATLAALPQPRYRSAFEVGCSIGVLTQRLAARCDALLAVDVADVALAQARRRCADLTHVAFAQTCVPAAWPTGMYDLVVLSEVVYYLDAEDVRRLGDRLRASVLPGGDIVLVHWLGETHYPLTGDAAAVCLIDALQGFATIMSADRHGDYRLDVLHAAS